MTEQQMDVWKMTINDGLNMIKIFHHDTQNLEDLLGADVM
jgi:hypothetical protein